MFEATSAYVHVRNAPRYRKAGIHAVDLTPAARGPYVIPPVNLTEHLDEMNVNMVTCGGQATIPMVYAVSRVVPVEYAEIVATVSSASAGPGTRNNIDEFTRTTSKAVEVLGGATRGKAIIILNPAEPPLMMRDTIFCSLPGRRRPRQDRRVDPRHGDRGADLRARLPPARRAPVRHASTTAPAAWRPSSRSQGAGDFLPPYAGNLDIMTAAAAKVGDEIARHLMGAATTRRGGTDMPYSERARHPHHRHVPARRLARQASPVHRGRRALDRHRTRRAPACR